MNRGFMYLVAVMDWHSRKILSWRISNTLDTDFCVEAVEEALSRYGVPEIFNTDQGAQFTSNEFTELLKSHKVQISMDLLIPSLQTLSLWQIWLLQWVQDTVLLIIFVQALSCQKYKVELSRRELEWEKKAQGAV